MRINPFSIAIILNFLVEHNISVLFSQTETNHSI